MDRQSKRPPRIDVSYPAILIRAHGDDQTITITDISATGFSLEGQEGLRVGEQVFLRLGKEGNDQAEVRWVEATRAGGVLYGLSELR